MGYYSVHVKELRNIPKFIHDQANGPYLEYKFKLNFRNVSELIGRSKLIRVRVVHKKEYEAEPTAEKIEVVLIKPDSTDEINLDSHITTEKLVPSFMLARFNLGNRIEEVTIFDDPIRTPDLDNRPPPPNNTVPKYEYLVKDEDPNGLWTIRIKNKSIQSANFYIDITHPDMQLPVVISTIPLSLINRLLEKINKLMDVKVKIDEDLTLNFSEKFKHMTGFKKKQFHIGTKSFAKTIIPGHPLSPIPEASVDIDYSLRDINLNNTEIKVVKANNSNVLTLSFHLQFETNGVLEINVVGPNVNITQLEVNVSIPFQGSSTPIYTEERNLSGERTSSFPPISKIENIDIDPIIKAEDFLIFNTQDGITSGVNNAIVELLENNDTKKTLKLIAEHFTDMILFLASGKENQILHDIICTNKEIIVRHYDTPSTQLRRDAELISTTPDGGRFVATTFGTTARFARVDAFQPSVRDNLAIEADTGIATNSRKIEHIVVMMLENRSFDHMLGYLTKKKNRQDIDGLTSGHTNPIPASTASHSSFKLTDGGIIDIDPTHSVEAVKEQIADGAMSGFVSNYMKKRDLKNRPGDEKLIMGYFDDDTLEVYDQLAEEFMVCDRWFSSHPGATYPNRFISVMGSAPDINNFKLDDNKAGAVKGDTIFDILTEEKITWNYVESNIAFLRMFDKYRVDEENIIQREEWLNLARNGNHPAVSWIDPHIINLELEGEADDDHPPANVRKGQEGVLEIYNALTSNPANWNKTLLIITYDEHGGFYDHVPPHGLKGEKNPEVHKIHKEGENYYGLRVPAIIVSPLVKKGSSSHTVFDHTSLLKTILHNFIGPEATTKELLGKRTDAANSLLDLLEVRGRAEIPIIKAPRKNTTDTRNNPLTRQPFDEDSFHESMLLFGLGPKFRKLVKQQAEK